MSRRRFARPALLALSGAALLFAATTLGAGCTTETTVVEPAADGGDAGKDTGPKFDANVTPEEDSGAPPQTEDECIAECEKKHTAGLAKDKLIDQCWESKCKAPCVDGTGGFDGGAGDAGDGGADGGGLKCTNDVDTGDDSCDQCTSANCCASWDGCFNDQDCTDLNDCRNACIE